MQANSTAPKHVRWAFGPRRPDQAAAKLSRIPVKVERAEVLKKPDWIRVKAGSPSTRFYKIKQILRENKLNTVCEEASCPTLANALATLCILAEVLRDFPAAQSMLFVSGPEGGLSSDEEALARAHGFLPVTLGTRVLRAETAALLALALTLA